MITIKGKKYTSVRDLHERHMKDPGYREAYKAAEAKLAIYDRLIRMRIERKLTQKELAKKMGAHQSAIARFESGTTEATLGFAVKVAQALGVQIKVVP